MTFKTVLVTVVASVGLLSAAQTQGGVFKVGGGVTAPRVLERADPAYTPEASAAKIEGTVLLSVVVGTDGMAHDINVVKSLGNGLDEQAAIAVQKWHFAPGTKDGAPVQVKAQIEVNFRLK
jgi:TonB family protein